MDAVLNRLERIAARMEQVSLKMSLNGSDKVVERDLETLSKEYNERVLKNVPPFVEAVKTTCQSSGPLMDVALIIETIFNKTQAIIVQFASHKKPSKADEVKKCIDAMGQLIGPDIVRAEKMSSAMRRDDPLFNHIMAMTASLSAFYWFGVAEPIGYVQEMIRATEFYTNRILAAKTPDYSDFTKSHLCLLTSLLEFVRSHYPSGVTWSSDERCVECSIDRLNLSAPPPCEAEKSAGNGVPAKKAEPRDPSIRMVGKRWLVEKGRGAQANCREHVVSVAEMRQSVYIVDCANLVIRIAGPKVNSVSLDCCQKVDVLIEGAVVSQLECVNCKAIRIQAMHALQTATVDKTDGFHLFLSRDSNCQLFSSLSSEVALSYKNPIDESFVENAVPMQFVTAYDRMASSVVTSVAENPCSDSFI